MLQLLLVDLVVKIESEKPKGDHRTFYKSPRTPATSNQKQNK